MSITRFYLCASYNLWSQQSMTSMPEMMKWKYYFTSHGKPRFSPSNYASWNNIFPGDSVPNWSGFSCLLLRVVLRRTDQFWSRRFIYILGLTFVANADLVISLSRSYLFLCVCRGVFPSSLAEVVEKHAYTGQRYLSSSGGHQKEF